MPRTILYQRDFKALALLRAKEARALLSSGNEQGAYYLAGYAIECALKACIAGKTKRSQFPPSPKEAQEFYTHDLSVLLKAAGLDLKLDADMNHNRALATNWNTVKLWNEKCRYTSSGLNGKDLYKSIRGNTEYYVG